MLDYPPTVGRRMLTVRTCLARVYRLTTRRRYGCSRCTGRVKLLDCFAARCNESPICWPVFHDRALGTPGDGQLTVLATRSRRTRGFAGHGLDATNCTRSRSHSAGRSRPGLHVRPGRIALVRPRLFQRQPTDRRTRGERFGVRLRAVADRPSGRSLDRDRRRLWSVTGPTCWRSSWPAARSIDLRNQLAHWEMLGLAVPDVLREEVFIATQHFSRAATAEEPARRPQPPSVRWRPRPTRWTASRQFTLNRPSKCAARSRAS